MPSALKQSLEKLAKEKAPGPNPSFSTFHFLLAIELIAEESIGRNKLAEELGIGEGAARTLIGRLKDEGLILISKAGCSLTDKGLKLWNEYRSTIKKVRIEKNELTFADHSFAILVRNSGHKVKTGIEQRDAAIMAGAKGATTILFQNGHLIFPSVDRNIKKDYSKASDQIMHLFKPQENDTVIVVSSDSSTKAEHGALAAAWTLLDCS
jgi:DNA-binding transcriptional regulator PaaX